MCIWTHLVNGTGNSPSPGRPTPGLVKQDKSSGGSVDTTKTRSGPQRVRMSSCERPIGAAKGKQPDTEALCQPPPSRPPCARCGVWGPALNWTPTHSPVGGTAVHFTAFRRLRLFHQRSASKLQIPTPFFCKGSDVIRGLCQKAEFHQKLHHLQPNAFPQPLQLAQLPVCGNLHVGEPKSIKWNAPQQWYVSGKWAVMAVMIPQPA